jgi:hypothetical protein
MNGTPDGLRAMKGYILGLGRSRERELEEFRDRCRRIPVGCGII